LVALASGKLTEIRRNTAETEMMEKAEKTGENLEKRSTSLDRKISVAPMMDWTDKHCRYFLRGLSPHALLYTEMITAAAILRGDRDRLLSFDPEEHPVALQLGGSEPEDLAKAAQAGEEFGYDEINLNCGCPSDRVASGAFGACLMLEPGRVADCVAAMRAVVSIPVTVKMRVGVISATGKSAAKDAVANFTEADFEALHGFVHAVQEAGCEVAIVHARKAVLGGLSPKDNREIPPLRYDVVRRLREAFPGLPLIVNGGFRDVDSVQEALSWSDGVMLGREAYHRPFVLAELERVLYPDAPPIPSREELLDRMARYAKKALEKGDRLSAIARHMLGLYGGEPGAREYRRTLSEGARSPEAGPELFRRAIPAVRAL
jgi:tRNA-dihydrouridine synthase A